MPEQRPIAVLHTVGSLIPHSGVTPFIYNSLSFRARRGLPTACLYFGLPDSAAGAPEGWLHPLAQPAHPWQQFRAFANAARSHITRWREQGLSVVVHDHGLWLPCNLASTTVANRLRCPYVVSPHGMLQPTALVHAGFKKQLAWQLYERRRLRGASRIHVTAPVEAEAVQASLPGAPMALVKLGIDVPPACPDHIPSQQQVLYLGRLHPLKGVELLINAWALARPERWHLRLIGPCEPDYQAQLLRMIDQQGLTGQISIDGPLYDAAKQAALAQTSILILPSFSENFGMVVCEALAQGLPVITTDKTPWLKLPEKGCGWICSANAQDMARTLRQATDTPAENRARMGRAGWAWMHEAFDLPVVMQELEQHYQELCDA